MKNKTIFSKVRHIKSGREFLAEYSSEAAEWYEEKTGKPYDITEVEIVDLNPLYDQPTLTHNEI